MKLGSLNIPPAARVIVFVLGVVSAWVTLKHITTGVTHYGGVVSTRANEPLAYWAVVATTTFTTALLFCAALLKTKKRNESASANRLPAHTPATSAAPPLAPWSRPDTAGIRRIIWTRVIKLTGRKS